MLRCHTANFDIVHVHVDVSCFDYAVIPAQAGTQQNLRTKRASQLAHYFLDIKSPAWKRAGDFFVVGKVGIVALIGLSRKLSISAFELNFASDSEKRKIGNGCSRLSKSDVTTSQIRG